MLQRKAVLRLRILASGRVREADLRVENTYGQLEPVADDTDGRKSESLEMTTAMSKSLSNASHSIRVAMFTSEPFSSVFQTSTVSAGRRSVG